MEAIADQIAEARQACEKVGSAAVTLKAMKMKLDRMSRFQLVEKAEMAEKAMEITTEMLLSMHQVMGMTLFALQMIEERVNGESE